MVTPFNNLNFNPVSNTPAGLVGQVGAKETSSNAQMQQTNSQLNAFQFQQIEIPTLNFENILMEKETILKYLQNLMKLPNSVEKFVEELNQNKNNPKYLEILSQNLINVKALNDFLNLNSKEAIQKLLQTLSELSKTSQEGSKQLGEIFSLLNALQQNTSNNQTSIKEFLLLYIPLNIQEYDKSVSFTGFLGAEENIQNNDLTLMIETLNFSNILCALNSKGEQVLVNFYCNSEFPYLKYEKIIQTISKELNLRADFDFKPVKTNNIKNEKQNFIAQSNGSIQTNSLILAHVIIKTIFKIDNEFILKNEDI